jgi:hypothetical protein
VTSLDSQEAAERIWTSAIRTHLVAALDYWAGVRNNLHRGAGASLRALADLADNDSWRQHLRQAAGRGERPALEKLADAEGVLSQPPANLVLLSRALRDVRSGAPERLLQRAQAEHPADFWINLDLANILHGKKPPDLAQAIRFYQAALALRPQSPVTHNNFGVALAGQGKLAEAEAAYSKAIALQPDYAEAQTNLGAALAELNASGSALLFSTYLGGSQPSYGTGIALDGLGRIYVTGQTGSTNFPTTSGAFQPTFGGTEDAFIAKISLTPLPASPSFAVAGFPSPTTAGVAHTFTVTALNADGTVNTGYTGTVHFASNDLQAVLPADHTFTAADQGRHTFTATLKTAGNESITATDLATGSVTGTEAGIVVQPVTAAKFILSAPVSLKHGGGLQRDVDGGGRLRQRGDRLHGHGPLRRCRGRVPSTAPTTGSRTASTPAGATSCSPTARCTSSAPAWAVRPAHKTGRPEAGRSRGRPRRAKGKKKHVCPGRGRLCPSI